MFGHWDIAAILTMLFMVFAVMFWVTRPNVFKTRGEFSRSHLVTLLLVLVFGMSTINLPLARTVPPVMGRSGWSILSILSQAELRYSPPALEVAESYVVIFIAAIALFLRNLRKWLWLLGLLGILGSSRALNIGHDLLFPWFTHLDGTLREVKVDYGPAMYALPVTMSLLLLLSIDDARTASG